MVVLRVIFLGGGTLLAIVGLMLLAFSFELALADAVVGTLLIIAGLAIQPARRHTS